MSVTAESVVTGLSSPDVQVRWVPAVAVHRTRQWHGRYVATLAVADGLAVTLGALAAGMLRFDEVAAPVSGARWLSSMSYLTLTLVVAPLWVLSMAVNGVYERRRLGAGTEEYRRIFDAAVRFLAALAVVVLALKLDIARGFVALALPLATVLTVAAHHVGRRWLRRQRAAGHATARVLVVGREGPVTDLVRHLRRANDAGLSVVGACLTGSRPGQNLVVDGQRVPVLGHHAAVLDPLRLAAFDSVALADRDAWSSGEVGDFAERLTGSGVDLLLAPTVSDVPARRVTVLPVDGVPLLHLEERRLSGLTCIERVLSGLLLTALSPLVLLGGLAVRLSSRGPALFSQTRVGQGGRPMTIWKIRTMRVTAEAERSALAHLNEHDGLLFKIRRDPRVTPVGRVLRRLSIDELPQLWNVVRGDMSLIGPRPPLPDEVDRYSEKVRRRLLVKPGLTGLWQVSGRADLPWEQGVELDLEYMQDRTLTGDLAILCKTVTAVLGGKGAY